MRLLSYRELFWNISLAPSGAGFVIATHQHEHEMFDIASDGGASEALPIDLSGLMNSSAVSAPKWTRHRVSADEARSLGAQLWAALPPQIRESLQFGDARVRLKVSTEVPAVGDLPWEWLSDETDPPFALRPDFILVRSVPLRFPVHPLSVKPPLRVLLVVPDPKDERLLNAADETKAVTQGLSGPEEIEVSVLDSPQFGQLVDALATGLPNVVHYIGHGGLTHGEGSLVLQAADGRSRWVPATELAALLPSSVRLLCLSSPFTTPNYQALGLSHLARAVGLTGLPTTLANQYPVGGAVVAEFWTSFYGSLLNLGGNANEALQAARLHAASVDPGYADWGSFSLVIRDQTGISFELRPGEEVATRRAAEFRAQFAAEAANELAQQVQLLGEKTPPGLRKQYQIEQERVTGLLRDLSEA